MKLGILTQPLNINYGGLLQNYALQQVLIRAGHEVETIDWQPPKVRWLRVCLSRVKWTILPAILPHKYKKPKFRYIPTDKEMAVIKRNTNHFINAYIKHTPSVQSLSGFAKQAEIGQYDGYVVGSDQCWRPMYNPFLEQMFLSFAESTQKKVGYAVSFGTSDWEYSAIQTETCKRLAQKFDAISVRERNAVELCRKKLGVSAQFVLDPTMLLAKEDYEQLIDNENEPSSEGSLFYYILDPDESKMRFICDVEKGTGLKSFKVMPKYKVGHRSKDNVKNEIEDCIYPSATKWLRAFRDSKLNIVDSFHGCVFSIIYNVPFYVIGNPKRGNDRLESLLSLFGLEDRLISDLTLATPDLSQSIDWESVNDILCRKRNESVDFIINSLR